MRNIYKAIKLVASMAQNNGFGLERTNPIWDEYINRYVMLHSQQGTTFSGKLIKIQNGHAFLNPFQGAIYHPKEGPIRSLIYDTSKVSLETNMTIEPTTKESLIALCEFLNTQEVEKRKREKAQNKIKKSTN
jgi:hypothetical protein